MSIVAGTYRLGPENGTLSVRTARTGAAAKAGHDLLLHVTAWSATLEAAGDPADSSLALDADGASLRVREGTGGMQALGDADIESIHESIDKDVLKKTDIAFRSTRVTPGDAGALHVEGDLTLAGATHPIAFELSVDGEGALAGRAVVTQSQWGIKQYSILFGALKVADDVVIEIDAALPSA
jgi:polyisoprenoid-binding protein YceI